MSKHRKTARKRAEQIPHNPITNPAEFSAFRPETLCPL
jgi:hypothetical protein